MKAFHTSASLFCLLTFTNLFAKAQLINENFNTGLSPNWTQNPAGTWTLSPNLGTVGSSCIFSENLNTNTVTVNISTPTVNISSVTNVTVSFKAGLVGNNFIVPNVSLVYDTPATPQFMARWGSGFSPGTTYTVTGSYDYTPPLDAVNVNWINCTHTFTVNAAAARFIFYAEFVNGGYVLLEEILISGTSTTVATGIEEPDQNNTIKVYPNPLVKKKVNVDAQDTRDIFLTDNLGRKLDATFTKSDSRFEVDLSEFANGIYYITVVKWNGMLIPKKIVVE